MFVNPTFVNPTFCAKSLQKLSYLLYLNHKMSSRNSSWVKMLLLVFYDDSNFFIFWLTLESKVKLYFHSVPPFVFVLRREEPRLSRITSLLNPPLPQETHRTQALILFSSFPWRGESKTRQNKNFLTRYYYMHT